MSNKNILAIDTSRDVLEVAVRTENGTFLDIRFVGLKHSELLMPVISSVLKNAGLDPSELTLIVCAKGPGSFTGLRIGMSTVKGIAASVECPVVSVPTLDAMAFGFEFFDGLIIPVIDAKKRRVYTSLYRSETRVDEYLDISPLQLVNRVERVLGNEEKCLIIGSGVHLLPSIPRARFIRLNSTPLIMNYLTIGEILFYETGADSEDSGPLYLRKSDAELSLETGKL